MTGRPALSASTNHTKRCPDCGLEKPAGEFGANSGRPDGLAFYCKLCFRRRAAATYRCKRAAMGRDVRPRYDGPADHERCADCGAVKALEEFHRAARQSGGRAPYCKPCRAVRQRRAHLMGTYGITVEQYAAMINRQGGVCACCRERAPEHVDHDHTTGAVRGVVCFRCNSGIGQFDDRSDLMRNAIAYLERTTCQRKRIATGVYQLTSPRPAAAASPSSSALRHLISSRRG